MSACIMGHPGTLTPENSKKHRKNAWNRRKTPNKTPKPAKNARKLLFSLLNTRKSRKREKFNRERRQECLRYTSANPVFRQNAPLPTLRKPVQSVEKTLSQIANAIFPKAGWKQTMAHTTMCGIPVRLRWVAGVPALGGPFNDASASNVYFWVRSGFRFQIKMQK